MQHIVAIPSQQRGSGRIAADPGFISLSPNEAKSRYLIDNVATAFDVRGEDRIAVQSSG